MVTVAELQALRQARLDLLTGKRVVSVQKDGRRIEYTAASLDELNRAINDAESVLGTTRPSASSAGSEVMKRTPVLIDVNGVPLRDSLSYNGGGAGFGGQMA
ncbi:gpW family protein, partial [Escherichia coli]|nr:gpW family protein [Escherichia coli]